MFDRPENNMQFILGVKGNAAKTMYRISFKLKKKQNKTKQKINRKKISLRPPPNCNIA